NTATVQPTFKRFDDPAALHTALRNAARDGHPTVVDFYADWCVECVQMEHAVFNQPQVKQALGRVVALQMDVTAYDAADRKLLHDFVVLCPPTIMFFSPDCHELRQYRLAGGTDVQGFLDRMKMAFSE